MPARLCPLRVHIGIPPLGVYRFDGVRFERLTAIDGNDLLSANTNAIAAAGTALWVGYNFGGISVFDQGKVRHYGPADGLTARTVFKIAPATDGTIWAATVDGLVWLDGQRWRMVTTADGLPAGRVLQFAPLPDGGVQVNYPQGVYLRRPGSRQFQRVAAGTGIETLQLLPNGNTLLVDHARRYSRYAPLTGQVTPLRFRPG